MGTILVTTFVAVFALLAVGALAIQILGLTGRMRRMERALDVEHRHRERLTGQAERLGDHSEGTPPVPGGAGRRGGGDEPGAGVQAAGLARRRSRLSSSTPAPEAAWQLPTIANPPGTQAGGPDATHPGRASPLVEPECVSVSEEVRP